MRKHGQERFETDFAYAFIFADFVHLLLHTQECSYYAIKSATYANSGD